MAPFHRLAALCFKVFGIQPLRRLGGLNSGLIS
jgi:hypothetical protein